MFKKFLGVIVSAGLSIAPLHATLPGEDLGIPCEAGVEAPMAVNSGAPAQKNPPKSKDWVSKGIEISEYVEFVGLILTVDLGSAVALDRFPYVPSRINAICGLSIEKYITRPLALIPALATFSKIGLVGLKLIKKETRGELAKEFTFKRILYSLAATFCAQASGAGVWMPRALELLRKS
jgi:hypothetical protein